MPRALLDTNIIVWREAAKSPRADIGQLFLHLDKLGCEKIVHPETLRELSGYHDQSVVAAVLTRTGSYQAIQTLLPLTDRLKPLFDSSNSQNTRSDIVLLNEIDTGRVDILVTEDRGIRRMADSLGIKGVLSIREVINMSLSREATFPDFPVPTIRKVRIGELNHRDQFFDSLRDNYDGFDRWLARKSDEYAYVLVDGPAIGAFMYLKIEGPNEDYSDITPPLPSRERLKIGTLKVTQRGFRIGERLLRIAFDCAIRNSIDEIYLTMHDQPGSSEHERLKKLLTHWGFRESGVKKTSSGNEIVLLRDVFSSRNYTSVFDQYPRLDRRRKAYLVPIYPAYHTDLFPDSILTSETPSRFQELKPHRNSIAKAYVSGSFNRGATAGDTLIFYRTSDGGPAWYRSVVTTVAIVEKLVDNILSFQQFADACRSRSVFNDEELLQHWQRAVSQRPCVIHLLHVASFSRKLNRKFLIEHNLIPREPPRGLTPLSWDNAEKILGHGEISGRLIVN